MANIEIATLTPLDLRDQGFPCVNCLSDSQLMMVAFIVLNFIYNEVNRTDTTPTDRLQQMGCQNCLTDKQLLQGLVARLIAVAADLGYDAAAGVQDASCAQCADTHQIKVAVASLLGGIIGEQITVPI